MKPNPNPPANPQYTADDTNTMNGNAANATPFNGDSPDRSNANSPEERPSPPRMYSLEADGMDVDVEDDEKQNTEQQRRGTKRAWSEDETTNDQKEPLSSSEPLTKKRRTQESITQAGTSTISEQSQARENKNLRQLVKWTCKHVLEMNQGLPFKIGDTFSPNTFAQFRNALEQAIQSNTPELVQKLLETGMQNCVAEVLDDALTLACSVGAEDVIALLNPNSSSSSSSTTALPTTCASEKNWQQKVNVTLSDANVDQINELLTDQNNPLAANALLFGEDTAQWPKGEFRAASINFSSDEIRTLLTKCGAVCLAGTPNSKLVLFSSDFDHEMFRSGLLDLYLEEQSLLENRNDVEDKNDILFFTTQWGDIEAMRLLLQNGASPGAVDDEGISVLMTAANKGHIEIMELLLTYRVDINAWSAFGFSALNMAAENGYLTACRLLLQHGARLNEENEDRALVLAAKNGHAEICQLLIEEGANHPRISEMKNEALSDAAWNGYLDVCKVLVSYGADINYINYLKKSILCAAAGSGNLELVKYLWAQGAKINEGKGKTTPLIQAVIKNRPEIVKFFLSLGVSINQANRLGKTALNLACICAPLEMATLLLEKGADPNMVDQDGDTPLVCAAKRDSVEITKLLIRYGAELFSDKNAGYKALKIAVRHRKIDIATILLQAHAPVELVQPEKYKENLVITAMRNDNTTTLIPMLELLLKHGAPLHATDKYGNNALMLAVATKNFDAMLELKKYGAVIGQINSNGQNALHIAMNALDISTAKLLEKRAAVKSKINSDDHNVPSIAIDALHNTITKLPWSIVDQDACMLVILLQYGQTQTNWPQLRKDAIIKAKNPLTREIILQSWAWPRSDRSLILANVAKNFLNRNELKNYIQFATTTSPANLSTKMVAYRLSLAGMCPSLIEYIRPYIQAIPQIKSQLFGNSSITHSSIVDSFVAGMALTLKKIRIGHGEHWKPYDGELSGYQIFEFLNEIANTELNQLIEHAANHETTNTALVFENLLETCFNSTFTAQTLPHSFPPYTAAAGTLTNALMAKGVYSALAIKIEAAWKSAWSHFVGKPMISDSGSSSSSSSSSSISSMDSRARRAAYEPDDHFGLFDYDLLDEQVGQLPVLLDLATYLGSPQGQELLEAFRTQLRITFDQAGENILDLPKAATEVPADAAKVYSELMFRQLHMLKQFIDPDQPK